MQNHINLKTTCRQNKMTHQQQVSRSGSAIIEHAVGMWCQCHCLHSCRKKTFWAQAVMQVMWC